MNINIVSGFLGAGKTTFINSLLQTCLKDENIAIIENEFGEIGIDGEMLNGNAYVMEINSGCVCCTLAGRFEEAIRELYLSKKYDRIIVEPTGIAKLEDVKRGVYNAIKGLDDATIQSSITVVDVTKSKLYSMCFGEFFNNQITFSDTVILTRIDKANEKDMENSINLIKQLNSDCNIHKGINVDKIDEIFKFTKINKLKEDLIENIKNDKDHHIHEDNCSCHKADEMFQYVGFISYNNIEKSRIKEILKTLENVKEYGMILRVKGYLKEDEKRFYEINSVKGEVVISDIEKDTQSRICVIGVNLQKEKIENLFYNF